MSLKNIIDTFRENAKRVCNNPLAFFREKAIKVGNGFRENAYEACHHPVSFFRKKAMNLAGLGYFSGGAYQGVISGLHSGRGLTAAIINSTSSASNIIFGHTKTGVRVATGLGQAGIFPTLWPLLEKGDHYAQTSLVVFTAAQAVGFFGPELKKALKNSKHPVLRRSADYTRVALGLGNLAAHFIARIDPATPPDLAGVMDIFFGSDGIAMCSVVKTSNEREKTETKLVPG